MNILIVDDHPMIVSFYETALQEYFNNKIIITAANNCEVAYNYIVTSKVDYTITILDYSLPVYNEKKILSGVDLALLLRKYHKNCKIVIITAHIQKLLIYDILKKIEPEGIAIKTDISTSSFIEMISEVFEGNLYQSKIVKDFVKEIWKKQLIAEETNRQILFYLAKGYRVFEIENYISLTSSAIQKRLYRLKKEFGARDERDLIKMLHQQGFV